MSIKCITCGAPKENDKCSFCGLVFDDKKNNENISNTKSSINATTPKKDIASIATTLIDYSLILGFAVLLFGVLQKMFHNPIADLSLKVSLYFLVFDFILLALTKMSLKLTKNIFYIKLISRISIFLLIIALILLMLPFIYYFF